MSQEQVEGAEAEGVPRRTFFTYMAGGFGALFAAIAGLPVVGYVAGPLRRGSRRLFSKVAPLSSLEAGDPVRLPIEFDRQDGFLEEHRTDQVWVVRGEGEAVTVFSPVCPHLGCRYDWDSDKQVFYCPCHNSVFSKDGKVLSGPTPRPLDTLPQRVQDGELTVAWEQFKPGIAKKEPL